MSLGNKSTMPWDSTVRVFSRLKSRRPSMIIAFMEHRMVQYSPAVTHFGPFFTRSDLPFKLTPYFYHPSFFLYPPFSLPFSPLPVYLNLPFKFTSSSLPFNPVAVHLITYVTTHIIEKSTHKKHHQITLHDIKCHHQNITKIPKKSTTKPIP